MVATREASTARPGGLLLAPLCLLGQGQTLGGKLLCGSVQSCMVNEVWVG